RGRDGLLCARCRSADHHPAATQRHASSRIARDAVRSGAGAWRAMSHLDGPRSRWSGHPPQRHAPACVRRTARRALGTRRGDRIGAMLTAPRSPVTASMLRDIERGAPIEADHILGDLLARAGEQAGARSLLRIAYVHVKAYEARRARETASAAEAA